VIGTPSEEDKSFVTDQKAIEYLDQFQKIDKMDLKVKYPGATDEAIDFLNKTITFNPYFRLSIEDALEHPLFEDIRNEE